MGGYVSSNQEAVSELVQSPKEASGNEGGDEGYKTVLIVKVVKLSGASLVKSSVRSSMKLKSVIFFSVRVSLVREGKVICVGQSYEAGGNGEIVWNCVRPMHKDVYDTDEIYFELLRKKKYIIQARKSTKYVSHELRITAQAGRMNGTHDLELVPIEIKAGKEKKPPVLLTVHFLDVKKYHAVHKTVFFIRHGESIWNQAQGNGNVVGMLKQRDHELNQTGIDQCMGLHHKLKYLLRIDEKNRTNEETAFLSTKLILCSPLCRAVQTALFSLNRLEVFGSDTSHARLESLLREVENLGGMDSKVSVLGKDILSRVKSVSKPVMDSMTDLSNKLDKFCTAGASTDSITNFKESDTSVDRRVNEVINNLHYEDMNPVILVGHSLFFKKMFQSFKKTSTKIDEKGAAILEILSNTKLPNVGCVCLEINFSISFPAILDTLENNPIPVRRQSYASFATDASGIVDSHVEKHWDIKTKAVVSEANLMFETVLN